MHLQQVQGMRPQFIAFAFFCADMLHALSLNIIPLLCVCFVFRFVAKLTDPLLLM